METSHFLKGQDNLIESLTQDEPSKPNLLLVDVEPEFSSLLRDVLGTECTFFETFHFEQAKTLSCFERIDIALISIKDKPHPFNKSLDLILSLVDCHPRISIFLSLDQMDTENYRMYLQDGLIEHVTLDSDHKTLIQRIKNLTQKEKRPTGLPNTLKFQMLKSPSNPSLKNRTPYQDRKVEEHPGLNKNTFQLRTSGVPLPKSPAIYPKEVPIGSPSTPSLKLPFREPSNLADNKISKAIPISFSPRNKNLIKSLVQELAHKIKNPLVSIKTFTDLLKGRFEDASFREEFYPVVKAEIERINQTIESLVDFSEQLESQTLQTDFWPLFLESLDIFNKDHHGFFKLPPHEQSLPTFLIDPHQCQFALHLLYTALLNDLKDHTGIKITAGKYPENPSENDSLLIINFFLPAPIPRFLEHLEVILAQWVLGNFNAQFEETFLDGQAILHLIFFPLSKPLIQNKPWKTSTLSNDRRKKQVLIVFYDRRKSDRRGNTSVLSFKNRRNLP